MMKAGKEIHTITRSGRLGIHMIPVLVWVAAIAGVGLLLTHRYERTELVGVAFGETYDVSATCNGRVKSLPVLLYQEVQKDETLAMVNTLLDNERLQSELNAKKDVIESEIARLKAELEAASETLEVDLADRKDQIASTHRLLSVDVERTRLAVLELEAVLGPDRITLKDLELEVRIVKDLLAKEAVEEYELTKIELQRDVLAKRIEENEKLLGQADKNATEAVSRLSQFASQKPVNPSLGLTLNPIRQAILVQKKMIAELLVERVGLPLMAPFDGVVSQILRRPGESFAAGEPILTVAKTRPETVVGWIGEEQMHRVNAGMKVKIVRRGETQQIAMSEITVLGPAVEQLPERLWRTQGVPEYGRAFHVGVPPNLELTPSEKVGIKLM